MPAPPDGGDDITATTRWPESASVRNAWIPADSSATRTMSRGDELLAVSVVETPAHAADHHPHHRGHHQHAGDDEQRREGDLHARGGEDECKRNERDAAPHHLHRVLHVGSFLGVLPPLRDK